MDSHYINQSYDIPQLFYEVIRPYIDTKNRRVIETPSELFDVWQAALAAYDESPESAEAIAEWAMSAAASSPLMGEPQYEDIHVRFGQAEVPAQNNDEQWVTLKRLVREVSDTHSTQ